MTLSKNSLTFIHVASGCEVHQTDEGDWLVLCPHGDPIAFPDLLDATLHCEQVARNAAAQGDESR